MKLPSYLSKYNYLIIITYYYTYYSENKILKKFERKGYKVIKCPSFITNFQINTRENSQKDKVNYHLFQETRGKYEKIPRNVFKAYCNE